MATNLPQVDALNFNPTPSGPDINPVTRSQIVLYGDPLALAPLDQSELALFQAQFADLMSMVGSDERKIMLARVPQYILGLRAIKQALSGVKFDGINAGDTTIGMALIRPQFIRSAAAYRLNWNQALTPVWADWIFEGAAAPMTMGKDFGFVVTHIKSLVSPTPFMTECRFQVGRTALLLPADVRNLALADTENNIPIVPLPTMILIPKESFYARARSDVNGTENAPLGGLVFGLGRSLKEEIATWTT